MTLLTLCLALAGCTSSGKKAPVAATPGANPAPDPPRAQAEFPIPPLRDREDPRPVLAPASSSGLLAGQIIDNFNRRLPPVYIRVRESGTAPGAPIEVAADRDGYFTIQGLQVGKTYQLTATARDGDRLLAGSTWATPPNPRLVIRVSEDLVSPNTPQPPPAPALPKGLRPNPPPPVWPPENTAGGQGTQTQPRADQGWTPGGTAPGPLNPAGGTNGGLPPRGAGLGIPTAEPNPALIAGEARTIDPKVKIPAPGGPINPRQPEPPSPSLPPGMSAVPPVPSCSLTGGVLYNFALNDLSGEPWEFRKQHGRVTLIDFWGTWCMFCMQSIPHLKVLQDRYGQNGLKVVGIAYENGPPQYHAEQVERVRQRLQVNYTLLLGSDRNTCPVRTQFRVASWPTVFLVDENGRILWRGEGLDKTHLTELEAIIRQQLGVH